MNQIKILDMFPWAESIIVSIIGTVLLMAISIIFFGGYEQRPQKGGWFKFILLLTFLILTLAVIPEFDFLSQKGIQVFVLNFSFIFSMAVIVYESFGTYIVEKKIIPWLMGVLGVAFKNGNAKDSFIKIQKNKTEDGK